MNVMRMLFPSLLPCKTCLLWKCVTPAHACRHSLLRDRGKLVQTLLWKELACQDASSLVPRTWLPTQGSRVCFGLAAAEVYSEACQITHEGSVGPKSPQRNRGARFILMATRQSLYSIAPAPSLPCGSFLLHRAEWLRVLQVVSVICTRLAHPGWLCSALSPDIPSCSTGHTAFKTVYIPLL